MILLANFDSNDEQEERVFPAYNPCDMEVVRRYQLPPSSTQVQTHCGQIRLREDPAVFDYRVGIFLAVVAIHPFFFAPQVRAKPQGQPWPQWSPPQRPIVVQPPPPPRPPPPRPMPVVEECIQLLSLQKQGGSSSALRFGWSVRPSGKPLGELQNAYLFWSLADLLRCTAFIVSVTPRDGREPARQFRVDGSTNQYLVDGLRAGTAYAVSVQPVVNDRPCPGLTVDMSTDPVGNLCLGIYFQLINHSVPRNLCSN
jgi:hypothetical protein